MTGDERGPTTLTARDPAAVTVEPRVELGPLVYARADATGVLPSRLRARFSQAFGLGSGVALTFLALQGDPWMLGPAAAAYALAVAGQIDETVRQRRRLHRTPIASAEELARGWGPQPRRVVGTVEKDERSFRDATSGDEAVFVRTLFFESDGRGGLPTFPSMREDVRGVRFRVRLDNGSSFLVEPASLRVLTPFRVVKVKDDVRRALGAPTKGWRKAFLRVYQQRVCPGDTVEIAGRAEIDVSPRGAAAPGRGVPVLHSFVGAGGHEVPLGVVTSVHR
ncbi:MAG TPA: hypothetical protein VGG33_10160 [Polyangia bacterium]